MCRCPRSSRNLLAILGLLTIVKALVYVYLEELEFKDFGKEFRRAYYGREVTVTVVTANDNGTDAEPAQDAEQLHGDGSD